MWDECTETASREEYGSYKGGEIEMEKLREKYPYIYSVAVDMVTQMAKALTENEPWQAKKLEEAFVRLIESVEDENTFSYFMGTCDNYY